MDIFAPPRPDNILAHVGRTLCAYASDEIPEDFLERLPLLTWDHFDSEETASYQSPLAGDYIVNVYAHGRTKQQARELGDAFYVALKALFFSDTRYTDSDGVYIDYLRCSGLPQEARTAGQPAHYFRYSATYRIRVRAERE